MNYDYLIKTLCAVEDQKNRTRTRIEELRAEALTLYNEGKDYKSKYEEIADLQRNL